MKRWLHRLRYAGVAAALGGWLVILAAISRNPWFVFTENAFSDLGHPGAIDPWVFNVGMMVNGLLIVLYSLYLVAVSFNKAGAVGGGFMAITGVFLVLVGVFHEGSPHHFFVSVWFFTQAGLTVLVWGLALFREARWRRIGWGFLGFSLLGSAGALVVPWPSIAVAEAYGILVIDVWVALMSVVTPSFTDA